MFSVPIKTKLACCGAHLTQDGLVALQFVLLPILAQTFGLSYAQVGMIRAVNNAAMSVFEIPSGVLAERFGERRLLVFGLVCAGAGYLGIAYSVTYVMIMFCFLLAGAGAGFQHSLSSSVLVDAFQGVNRRRAMGLYNATGDMGKLAYTGIFSLLVGAGIAWNVVVTCLAVLTIGFGFIVIGLLEEKPVLAQSLKSPDNANLTQASRWGILNPKRFCALGVMVFLDSWVQVVFLTFLAFVLLEKGSTEAVAGSGVVLALAGGVVGKYVCGAIAARIGDRSAFNLMQVLTALGIGVMIVAPLSILLWLLPVIGMVVQGSSTVTYGSVADFISEKRRSRGYSLIYSLANGSSIAAPFLFGFIADQTSLQESMAYLILVVLMTMPFSVVLSKRNSPPRNSLSIT